MLNKIDEFLGDTLKSIKDSICLTEESDNNSLKVNIIEEQITIDMEENIKGIKLVLTFTNSILKVSTNKDIYSSEEVISLYVVG